MGFIVRPTKSKEADVKDELLVYCAQKIQHITISDDPKKKGKLIAKFRAISTQNLNKNAEKAFLCAAYFPSGRCIIGSSSGALYYCEGIKAIKMIKAHKDAVGALEYTEDGQLITGGSGKDKTLKIWTVKDDEKSEILKEVYNSGDVSVEGSDFEFAPRVIVYNINDKTVFVGSKSNQIISWNLEDKKGSLVIDGHDGQVNCVSCHSSEDLFITGGYDRALKVWNTDNYKCIATYEFEKHGDPWSWQRKQEKENGDDVKKC